jgi:hypothetical protein
LACSFHIVGLGQRARVPPETKLTAAIWQGHDERQFSGFSCRLVDQGRAASSVLAYLGSKSIQHPSGRSYDVIEVRRIAENDLLDFEVVVREGGGETRHHVTMSRETCNRLTGGKHTPERCVQAAFRFLLDREPKESILGSFDLTVISRYFPEFDREIPRYLAQL